MAKNVVTLNLDNTDYSFRPYGTCSTIASTAAKVVSITGFTLCTGATVLVKFTHVNAAPNPTLNINSTGAKPIKAIDGWSMVTDPNIYYEFLYDGTNWNLIGEEKRRCKLSSGNTNNYPWRRIAYTDVLTTTFQRRTIVLILNQAVCSGKYGELVIKVNSNGTDTASSYEAYWLINKGFSAGSIKIGVNDTFGNTYFDVFYKCPGTWQNLLIEEKTGGYDSNFKTSFTLCNSIEPSNTTTTDKLTSIESYASIEDAATELHSIAYTAIVEPNCTSKTSISEILFNGKSTDSDKLGGQLPTYYVTASVLDTYKTTVSNTYVKKTGDTMTGDLTIKTNSSGAPSIVLQRGETNDTYEDWKLTDAGGYFKIQNRNSENAWVDVLSAAPNTTKTLTSSYSILPSATNTLSLGNSTYKWSNVYATNFLGKATTASYLDGNTATSVNNCRGDKILKYYTLLGCTATEATGNKRYAGTDDSYGFPVSNNANGLLWLGNHSTNYGHQLGFSSNGNIYHRKIDNGPFPTIANGGSWKALVTTTGSDPIFEAATTSEIQALFS